MTPVRAASTFGRGRAEKGRHLVAGRLALTLLVVIAGLAAPASLQAGEPELRVALPQDPPRVGQVFQVVVELRWAGPPDQWIVRAMDGPVLSGCRDVGHVVAGGVGQGEGGAATWQRHELAMLADGEGPASVGPVGVDLVGEGGVTRRLSSRSLTLTVLPGRSPALIVAGGLVAVAVLLFAGVMVLRGRRRPAAVVPGPSPAEALQASLVELERLAAGDDVKALYGRALDLTVQLLTSAGAPATGRGEDDVAAAVADLEGIPPSLARGVSRLAEESKLVRFAGLRPDGTERSAVVARVRELAAFVGRSHSVA